MSRNQNNKKWFIVTAIVLMCFAMFTPVAQADTWKEKQKLLASDGDVNDWFGHSVSVSGNYAIVGAYRDDSFKGSAYIFRRDGNSWSEQQKLTASDGAASDAFGCSVSIIEDYAIVGAYGDTTKGTSTGAAYIFKRDGTSWIQQQKLLASDGAAYDTFGDSVSISGDFAIVGARGDNNYSGSAYIFKRDGNIWSEQQKITASDGAQLDYFGSPIFISGDYVILGAWGNDDKGDSSGSAYIFKRDGTAWSEQQKLLASDGAAGDLFGCSVSIIEDYAIVGAVYKDDKGKDSGSAYIFIRDGNSWNEQQKISASDGAAGDYFGDAVFINGDLAVVGAITDDDKGTDSGSVYLFKREGASWNQQQKLMASDGVSGDRFGNEVSISGGYLIVGAQYDDAIATNCGSAYIFKFCPSEDLNGDCRVDFADLAKFADWWLYGTD